MKILHFRPAAAVAALTVCSATVLAQLPPPARSVTPTPESQQTDPAVTTGRVAQWLLNPNGEVDGLLLDNGLQVAIAPHLSARLLDAVSLRDAVEITGLRDEAFIQATQIRSTRSGRAVGDAGPDAEPPLPRDTAALTPMTANGRITQLIRGPRRGIRGVVLDNGTSVRFPPHIAIEREAWLRPGLTLYAQGYGTRNALGSALEATTLGSSAASAINVFTGLGRAQGRPDSERAAPAPPAPPAPLQPLQPPGPPAPPPGADPARNP